jgi:capsular polysaccharide biosynthesis protein
MFWNKKTQIILIVAIFLLIGVIYTIGFVTPVYTSSTTLVLATSDSTDSKTDTTNAITTTDITLNSKLVSTYSEIVKSKTVLREVISNLGIDMDEEVLKKQISVSSVEDTELIEIAVTNENASDAAKIANETAKVFTKKIAEIYNINNVHTVDEAEMEVNPSNINHAKDIVIFTFVGLVVAVAYVLILNMLDTTINSAEEVEKMLDLPVLASIPLYDFDKKNEKGGRR